jgi:cation diffusion facilitator CzcD-associated flavoprotein CzcO
MWHSGAWRHDVDMAGRHVAVVGSAASAVQVVPAVAGHAGRVTVFSRSPNWVMPRDNRTYTPAEVEAFRNDPDAIRRTRRHQYRLSLLWYRAFRRDQAAIDELRRTGLANMRRSIADPAMIEALTPDFDPGCRRILVSDDYYPALAENHVELVPQGVAALTPTGIVAADGAEIDVDAIIFCTGYRLGGREDGTPAVEVHGSGGRRLVDLLAERAASYRGIGFPGFPNYFTVCGVNGVVSYTSVIASAELETELIATLAGRVLAGELRSIEPRADVTEHYTDSVQAEMSTMSWTGNCTNFYLDRQGRVVTFFPGTVGRMRRELRAIDDSDFHLERP